VGKPLGKWSVVRQGMRQEEERYTEVLLGYQLGQVVEWWGGIDIGIGTLRTRTEMVLKTLGFSLFNHLTWLIVTRKATDLMGRKILGN
jgi:hypothetical protein